jgi:predicted nucleic acid-binding protein
MAYTAFLDTCTLFGGYLCDTLLRLAEADLYQPQWSPDVLDELRRNLLQRGLAETAVDHRINSMRRAFPEAEVIGYQALIPGLTCHEKDRHVLAAAIRGNADAIITFNTRDFPTTSTQPYDIDVAHPDEFLLDRLDLDLDSIIEALARQAASYRQPPIQIDDLMEKLARSGVPQFADHARIRTNSPRP